jgi:ABC-type amino acid transport substrate-binding protein
MFTIYRLLIFAFLILFIASPVAAQKTLKLSVPPSIWAQEDGGKMTGPIIDFLSDFFAEFDIELVSVKLPWVRAVADMGSGQLDLIPVIFHTREREKSMIFSVPYVDVPTVVLVVKGQAFPFNQTEDLIGLKGLQIRNDSISPEFNRLKPKLDITEVSDHETMLKMLSAGRADYAVLAKDAFLVETKRLGYLERMEILPVSIASRSLHIAISRKSEFFKYMPEMNDRLRAMKANGEMKRIVEEVLSRANDI